MALKLVADELPEVQVIASGSSSFELMNRTAEPLTEKDFFAKSFVIRMLQRAG